MRLANSLYFPTEHFVYVFRDDFLQLKISWHCVKYTCCYLGIVLCEVARLTALTRWFGWHFILCLVGCAGMMNICEKYFKAHEANKRKK